MPVLPERTLFAVLCLLVAVSAGPGEESGSKTRLLRTESGEQQQHDNVPTSSAFGAMLEVERLSLPQALLSLHPRAAHDMLDMDDHDRERARIVVASLQASKEHVDTRFTAHSEVAPDGHTLLLNQGVAPRNNLDKDGETLLVPVPIVDVTQDAKSDVVAPAAVAAFSLLAEGSGGESKKSDLGLDGQTLLLNAGLPPRNDLAADGETLLIKKTEGLEAPPSGATALLLAEVSVEPQRSVLAADGQTLLLNQGLPARHHLPSEGKASLIKEKGSASSAISSVLSEAPGVDGSLQKPVGENKLTPATVSVHAARTAEADKLLNVHGNAKVEHGQAQYPAAGYAPQPGYAAQPGYAVQPGYAAQPAYTPQGYPPQAGYAPAPPAPPGYSPVGYAPTPPVAPAYAAAPVAPATATASNATEASTATTAPTAAPASGGGGWLSTIIFLAMLVALGVWGPLAYRAFIARQAAARQQGGRTSEVQKEQPADSQVWKTSKARQTYRKSVLAAQGQNTSDSEGEAAKARAGLERLPASPTAHGGTSGSEGASKPAGSLSSRSYKDKRLNGSKTEQASSPVSAAPSAASQAQSHTDSATSKSSYKDKRAASRVKDQGEFEA